MSSSCSWIEVRCLRAGAATPQYGEKAREVVKLLLQRGAKADWRSLFGAIHFDDPDLIRILVSPDFAALDINQKDTEGYTALDEAVQ